ncbi:D12 class N6 adenine-specific DNA methyltransferase [Gleimia coleocanis DSM 15436]|uniref:site-specific DNA-methyltransferase (adenine-specific) n=1 Tax=Gleimia coleocanis DSM 15436 TaxID=525245 RepID=C0VZK1_9ACTO|nr:DNA adenine methylase [Gleimia coleocanis]EEH64120.1 D12 class N6 adenine-specific DNA methyltransferase [Gleimia coleocanis DSM 15436]
MFKYIGSKRVFIPTLGTLAQQSEAKSAVDLFTGTTRVAQEFKRQGLVTTACDIATYSHVLAQTYVATDSAEINEDELRTALQKLNELPGDPGYFTETFCQRSRFFQPKNGARIDAIRNQIETEYKESQLYPLLLTSLMEAADRVDSTIGVQMAYLKQWAPRSYNDLEMRMPVLTPGKGQAVLGDAMQVIDELPPTELLYLDPPYNQHRYYTNYHIWETLVRWDEPEVYGVACKRVDAKEAETKSVFNYKRTMKDAFFDLLTRAKAGLVVISYNNESWISAAQMRDHLLEIGCESVVSLGFEHTRYVGAKTGIHSPTGQKVGSVSHTKNMEWVFVAGSRAQVSATVRGFEENVLREFSG